MSYSSLVMSTTTIHLWSEAEDSLWINLNQIAMVLIMSGETVSVWIVVVSCPIFSYHWYTISPEMHTFKLSHIMVYIWLPFITNTSINWNLQHPPPLFPGSSPGIWTFKDWFVEIPTARTKIVFKCPHQFLKRAKSANMTFCTLTKLENLDLL